MWHVCFLHTARISNVDSQAVIWLNKKDCIFSLFLPAYVAIAFQEMIEFCCRYFAVCFLNQLILTKRDRELATRLISIYFSFFGVSFL